MCKICKTCGQSNFGVTLKKTEERAVRMINGKITEYFEGSEEIQEAISINYCFTCGSKITEEDLIEMHICKVCKTKVEQANENGVCTQCAEEVDKLSEASREDLILMILKQNKKIVSKSCERAEENKIANQNKEEKNKEKLVKNNKKSDTIKRVYKTAKNSDSLKVETDKGKKVSSKRKIESKVNNKINTTKKENKEATLISQENMDKAINDNKEKIKSAPKIKSADSKSLDYVTDKLSIHVEDVKDIVTLDDIKDHIDISNIDAEITDNEVINNTLIEIEDIINNMSSFNMNNKNYE